MQANSTETAQQAASLSPQQEKLLATATLKDPQLAAHANEFYAAMRLGDPVHFDPVLGSWLVSRFDDMQEVFRDPITFSANYGLKLFYAGAFAKEFREILERDGGGFFEDVVPTDPHNPRIRKLMEQAFTARRVKSLEARIVELVNGMIDQIAERGRCDAIREFAQPMTIAVICEQLGFEQMDAARVERWSHAVMQTVSAMQTHETMLENAKEMAGLQLFLLDRLRERQDAPREDITSDLVHAVDEDGSKLSLAETLSLTRAMIAAGNETTATAVGNLFFLLATNPEQTELLRQVADDDRQLTRWVEEFLRLYPPVRCISRGVTREVELAGKVIPKDAHMLLLFPSANYDENAFPDPMTFDMTRGNLSLNTAFGGGAHRCVGSALARMEIKVAAREVIKRLKDFKLEIDIADIKFVPTVTTRSFASLPMSFSRVA
jgi:cytochrome P450